MASHDEGVPVGGPALVHDLGLSLRGEVVGLLADDREDVPLPVLERRVLDEEVQDIALRTLRETVPGLVLLSLVALALGGQQPWRVDEFVHVPLALELPRGQLFLSRLLFELAGRPALDGGRVDVDQVLY